ncbi:thioredoxin-like domain-containing protein [Lentisphaera marina]|uniref:thioredoxin-like domain-containing protein n=1 Tax=Lentisphaera marina TaxID=1111041 RepID=UPI002365A8CA|nr:thioredoxin-like domain-containing protein [Lentisphaera marina]MDD7986457.1 thioredoxin-like domain-containing protein [Lentisphaera marina]
MNKIMIVLALICGVMFLSNLSNKKEASPVKVGGGDKYPISKIYSSIVDKTGASVAKHGLENRGYILVYYSASWCPPCRQFTPILNKYYLENRKKQNFDVLLVCADRSEQAMLSYMKKMSFNAIDFDKIRSSGLGQYSGRGIPNLTVFDNSGNVVLDGRKMHAMEALEAFKKLPKKSGKVSLR